MNHGRWLYLALLGALLFMAGCEKTPVSIPMQEETSSFAEYISVTEESSMPEENPLRFSKLVLHAAAVPVTADSYLEVGAQWCDMQRTLSQAVPGEYDYRYLIHNLLRETSFELSFVHQPEWEVLVTLTVEGETIASYQAADVFETFGESCQVYWLDASSIWVLMPGCAGIYDVVLNAFMPLEDMTAGLGYPEGFWGTPDVNRNLGLVALATDRMDPVFWMRSGMTLGLYHVTNNVRIMESWTSDHSTQPLVLWDKTAGGAYYYIGDTGELCYIDLQTGRKTQLEYEGEEVAALCNGLALVRGSGADAWSVVDLANGEAVLEPQGRYVGLLYMRYFVFQAEEELAMIDPYTSEIYTYPLKEEAALRTTIIGSQYFTFGEESHRVLLAGEESH